MLESREYTIVHVEDDASHWQPLTSNLEAAIGEYLATIGEGALASLMLTAPPKSYEYPSCTTIRWKVDEVESVVNYWLVVGPEIAEINAHLDGRCNITFVLDVMRPQEDAAGLHSTLEKSLRSIDRFVSDSKKQIRLFTAYSSTDGIAFPPDAPEIFKKGIETSKLLTFLLNRIGIGDA